ncbi:DVL family [Arabidopsis thaliana x Arabidopsis arenosa]|uniref:DVL family n=1 Tax=Arabidopsis thaliana x Arabidopsis arenosa TaxID=1240361 RepID=A0A8T1ZNS0_9BRAS|nr:DVL family [Arabidopsis thaliana x Arabidopsis arenosa]
MDVEKLWNHTKKDSIFQTTHFSSSSKPFFTRSFSTKTSSSPSSKSHFTRSFSTKPSSSSCSSEPIFRRSFSAKPKASKSLLLSRSCSTKSSADFSSKSSLSRSLSQKGASVTRKCFKEAKEQKSRFYIIKRCVLMLVCWHKHS